ncbi:MAG: urocanate hydratase [Oscillospiraceae bacterium]|nr:urocanate hydratase [Oscillospiraceae bacterium]
MFDNKSIKDSMTVKLTREDMAQELNFDKKYRRAPKRAMTLSKNEIKLAVKNALRYIEEEFHEELAKEFYDELMNYGRIYGYRFRPDGAIFAKPVDEYKGNCVEAKAFQLMIDNNLDFNVALYPYELVTYGESGQVCANWMQYRLIKKYLEVLDRNQTLVVASGHPVGLFHSSELSPRVIITNGLMVGMFDDIDNFNRAASLGVANYGQMTAGGWMYIGPQGIVHGTYNTILNAGRLFLGVPQNGDLTGKLFVTSGLGGMSGAQGKACEIARGVSIIAEVDLSRITTRYEQGWVNALCTSPVEAFNKAFDSLNKKEPIAIAFHGNIVDLLQYAIDNNIHIDLLSDQTSCHEVYSGGYCPCGISFEERTHLLSTDKEKFKELVNITLRKHFEEIKVLTSRGTYFFDYGNSFLKAIFDSGIKEISKNGMDERDGFIWPSYVEDILGPELFDFGYGPFRWVCLSLKDEDLDKTDKAAMECIDPNRRYQDLDNYNWIRDAKKNSLVVGSKARILYQDASGRLNIALKFNDMVRRGEIGPIMMGRDHHDVSGTDSPFRETSNIKDGSNVMADMAIHCFAGNAARGMSMVALHNGGGVGTSKAINGGFGLVLDGSDRVDEILKNAMLWDVMSGVARRSWARNKNAMDTAIKYNEDYKGRDHLTIPYVADDALIDRIVGD